MSDVVRPDTEPYFSSEAQEVFVAEERVFALAPTPSVGAGAEGTYVGRLRRLAVVDWDTPSGVPYREAVSFDSIKNLYR